MALDCQSAFSEEMAALNAIKDSNSNISATTAEIKESNAKILTALQSLATALNTPSTPSAPVGLEAKIDETNRLLKLLCKNLIGKE